MGRTFGCRNASKSTHRSLPLPLPHPSPAQLAAPPPSPARCTLVPSLTQPPRQASASFLFQRLAAGGARRRGRPRRRTSAPCDGACTDGASACRTRSVRRAQRAAPPACVHAPCSGCTLWFAGELCLARLQSLGQNQRLCQRQLPRVWLELRVPVRDASQRRLCDGPGQLLLDVLLPRD